MAEWVVEIEHCLENDFAINVIQGDRDSTLDWRHNMKLLQRKFPNLSLQMIAGAGHHMVNEAPTLREKIFAALKF